MLNYLIVIGKNNTPKLQRRILRVSLCHRQLPLKEKSRSPAPLFYKHPARSS